MVKLEEYFLHPLQQFCQTLSLPLLDPWDARTIEWTIPSPTPVWNFSKAPHIKALDDFWHAKYDEDEEGRAVRRDSADALLAQLEEEGLNPEEEIELPDRKSVV